MTYNGFRSISEFEKECASHGYSTQRIPFCKDGHDYFVLVCHPPQNSNGPYSACSSWSLIDNAETTVIERGVISSFCALNQGALQDGVDVNYLGKLAKLGYFPAVPVPPTIARPEEHGKQLYLSENAPRFGAIRFTKNFDGTVEKWYVDHVVNNELYLTKSLHKVPAKECTPFPNSLVYTSVEDSSSSIEPPTPLDESTLVADFTQFSLFSLEQCL